MKQAGLPGPLPWSGTAHAARLAISSTSERQARLGGACLYRPEHGSFVGTGEFVASLDPVDTGIQIPNWVRLRPYIRCASTPSVWVKHNGDLDHLEIQLPH